MSTVASMQGSTIQNDNIKLEWHSTQLAEDTEFDQHLYLQKNLFAVDMTALYWSV